MGKLIEKTLLFPAAGVNRKSGFESQPPYSTPDCLNVRPFSVIDGRARGGVRPGLEKAYYQLLGSGNRVNLLTQYVASGQDAISMFAENFDLTTLEGTAWTAAADYGNVLPGIFDDTAAISYEAEQAGAVLTEQTNWIDEDQGHMIEIWIEPYNGSFGGTYALFARMQDSNPVVTNDGLLAEITMEDGTDAYTGTLEHYSGTVLQNTWSFSGGGTGNATGGRFYFILNGTSVKLYWGATLLTSQTITIPGDNTYRGVGFGMNCTVTDGACLISSFKAQFHELGSAKTEDRVLLVAASNGLLYVETFEGILEAVSTSLTLHASNKLQAASLNGKLYIGDHGNVVAEGTDGTIANTNELSATSIPDWTALGWNANDFVVVITDGVGVTDGVYPITGSGGSGAHLVLTGTPSNGTCSYRVERAMKVFDAAAGTLTIVTATAGQVPVGCRLLQAYRGRIIVGGDGTRLWYMSRQFDATDWDYAGDSEDYGRAVAGQNSAAGQIGYPITAIMPHHDDYLIFGTQHGVWILRGDPAWPAATLGPLSQTVGVIGGDAWCESQDGTLMFLSNSGMYGISPGGQGVPVLMSSALPRNLRNLQSDVYQVSMAFDERETGGVYVFVYQQGVGQTHWFMDWETKGFFPQTFQLGHVPFSVCRHPSAVQNTSDIMLGCSDGYIRRMNESSADDDGSAISSYVLIGPFLLGRGGNQEGCLKTIDFVAGQSGATLTWDAYVGDSAETARRQDIATSSGTLSEQDGVNYRQDVEAAGKAAMLKIACAGSTRWDMEHIIATIEQLGTFRKL